MDNKPGIKTTEFWVANLTPIFVPLIMLLAQKYGLPISEELVTNVVTMSIAGPLAYIVGRIINKVKPSGGKND